MDLYSYMYGYEVPKHYMGLYVQSLVYVAPSHGSPGDVLGHKIASEAIF